MTEKHSTAQVIPFPVVARPNRPPTPTRDLDMAEKSTVATVAVGDSWYHQAAIDDASGSLHR